MSMPKPSRPPQGPAPTIRRRSLLLALAGIVLAAAAVVAPPAVMPQTVAATTAASYLEGIDVSHWQGTINWSQVAAAGKKFAFIKATDGTSFVDNMYATNHVQAKAAGLKTGAYHFARPSAAAGNAAAQADLFVNTAQLGINDLLPALDLEVTGSLSVAALQSWVSQFLGRVVQRTGVKPMIYVSPAFWSKYLGNTTMFADAGYNVLWIAHWTTNASPTVPASNWGGKGWTFWQYTSDGSVPGISGRVDLDRFNGTDMTRVTYGANFKVSTVASQSVEQGVAASFPITIDRTWFTLPISLSVTGVPAGTTVTMPSTVTGTSATLAITTSNSGTVTPPGTYPLTITGTDGTLTHGTQVTLVVQSQAPAADFTISATPSSATATRGAGASYTVTITPTGGFSGNVTLGVTGAPSKSTFSFSPNPATSTSVLTVTTSKKAGKGTFTLTITGTSGGLSHTTTVQLVVQ